MAKRAGAAVVPAWCLREWHRTRDVNGGLRHTRCARGRAGCVRAPTRRASQRALRGCSRKAYRCEDWVNQDLTWGRHWVSDGDAGVTVFPIAQAAAAACAEPAAAWASEALAIALDSTWHEHRSISRASGCAGGGTAAARPCDGATRMPAANGRDRGSGAGKEGLARIYLGGHASHLGGAEIRSEYHNTGK